MKIVSVYIENFGTFSKKSIKFQDGLNQITKENGWGKSTLCSFIKAMFYGMKYTTGNEFTDRKKYLSFANGPVGGNLVFETGGKTYRIERFFGEKPKEDTFHLFDENTLRESSDFSENPGEELFGLDMDSFERSVFISGNHAAKKNPELTSSITSHLNGLLEDSDDMANFDRVMKVLEKELSSLKSQRGSSSNKTIDRLEGEIKDLEKEEREVFGFEKQREEKNLKLSKLHEEITLLGKNILDLQDQLLENQKRKKNNKNNVGFFILSVAFILVFIFGCYASIVWIKNAKIIAVLAMLPVLSIANFFLLAVQKKHEKKQSEKLPSSHELMEKIRQLQDKKDALVVEKTGLEKEIEFLENSSETSEKNRHELSVKKEELEAAQNRYKILNLTKNSLSTAKENLESNYTSELKNSFLRYMSLFEKEQVFSMDSKMNILLEKDGHLCDQRYFSEGYKDLSAFCARLSLAECLFEKEKPFLVLDDPFVNLDKEKLEKAQKVVAAIARNTQVIYFKAR